MESNVHTPWLQCSKIINKMFFFCLSISVINTTSYNRYLSVKNGIYIYIYLFKVALTSARCDTASLTPMTTMIFRQVEFSTRQAPHLGD